LELPVLGAISTGFGRDNAYSAPCTGLSKAGLHFKPTVLDDIPARPFTNPKD
jgi:hypothetical protein